MKKKRTTTQQTLKVLLAGKGSVAKKYAGKHVLVVKDEVVPLKAGTSGRKDWERLKKQYREDPVITFVPRHDITYILVLWQ